MPIIRVGLRGEITLPDSLRQETRISAGSLLEAEVHRNLIVLRPIQKADQPPNNELEAAIAEGLEDLQAGRVKGPFQDMAEFKARRHKQKVK
jgi:bifunctional DNA-binding transcriptional regulator/antitoxin component of YhaV-PrlF toxin-antitoxin module